MQKEKQVSFLAEKIRQADAVLIGCGSGLSSAAAVSYTHLRKVYRTKKRVRCSMTWHRKVLLIRIFPRKLGNVLVESNMKNEKI